MLIITGNLLGMFDRPESIDRETGEVRPARKVLQVQHQTVTKTGDVKYELADLGFEGDASPYLPYVGKNIYLDVRPYPSGFNVGYVLIGLHAQSKIVHQNGEKA